MNAKEEILKKCKEEDIEAILIKDKSKELDGIKTKGGFYTKGRIKEALKELDYEFDSGYGTYEGAEIYVWCKDCIIISVSYDGSAWYECVPRNPKNTEVNIYGGG